MMLKVIRRIFGDKGSGQVARDRMQVVLMHDRTDIPPEIMDAIKNEILLVVSRYMEIDNRGVRVDLEKGKEYTALVTNMHVKRVYTQARAVPVQGV